MFKKIFTGIVLGISAVCIGAGLQYTESTASADQGCPANQTRRATSLYPSTSYPTCALTLCSTYNPVWSKVHSSFSWSTAPMIVIDYAYVIQGGSYVGLPACRSEIDQSAGWSH